ncbi:MAG: glutathione S-transferase family protein [Myxococcota bacterium]
MKLYGFRYSPYARKVQMLLDLIPRKYELVEVPFTDREELAKLTGGYIYVPVLQEDDGRVIVESRVICERLLSDAAARRLVPSPFEGPIWAYADFVDGPLEDVLFRLASPRVRDAWPTAFARALYVLIKERKFGPGCVELWERQRPELLQRAKHLLAPTLRTLAQQPFLFGEAPTLADTALYGNCAMLEEASLLHEVDPALVEFARRVEAFRERAAR